MRRVLWRMHMVLWMVRAGRHGEAEESALAKGFVTIGWNELPNLSDIKSREALADLYRKFNPEAKKMTLAILNHSPSPRSLKNSHS